MVNELILRFHKHQIEVLWKHGAKRRLKPIPLEGADSGYVEMWMKDHLRDFALQGIVEYLALTSIRR